LNGKGLASSRARPYRKHQQGVSKRKAFVPTNGNVLCLRFTLQKLRISLCMTVGFDPVLFRAFPCSFFSAQRRRSSAPSKLMIALIRVPLLRAAVLTKNVN
jgi:hypothetical protein